MCIRDSVTAIEQQLEDVFSQPKQRTDQLLKIENHQSERVKRIRAGDLRVAKGYTDLDVAKYVCMPGLYQSGAGFLSKLCVPWCERVPYRSAVSYARRTQVCVVCRRMPYH